MADFVLNGAQISVDLPAGTPLIDVLRGHVGLLGTRFGCGSELCGSCMVLVDGKAQYSCTLALDAAAGCTICTIEGLGTPEAPHPVQSALLTAQAGQCGFCLSGIVISAAALLAANPDPSETEIRAALDRNLCRCGAHNRIVRAVKDAAALLRGEDRP